MSEMSDFSKFKLQDAISCNLKIFTCWPSEDLHNGPSALLAKLIRSLLIEFKLRKNLINDANGIPIYANTSASCRLFRNSIASNYSGRKRNLDTSKTKEKNMAKQGIKFHIPLSLLSVDRV